MKNLIKKERKSYLKNKKKTGLVPEKSLKTICFLSLTITRRRFVRTEETVAEGGANCGGHRTPPTGVQRQRWRHVSLKCCLILVLNSQMCLQMHMAPKMEYKF